MIDPDSGRRRRLNIGLAMVVAGAVGEIALSALREHDGGFRGGVWAMVIGELLIYGTWLLMVIGGMRIWFVLDPTAEARVRRSDRRARPANGAGVSPGGLLRPRAGRDGVGAAPLDRACVAIGKLGVVVLVLTMLCVPLSLVFIIRAPTVVVAGVPSLPLGAIALVQFVFSVIVGLCWSRMIRTKVKEPIVQAMLTASMLFMMMTMVVDLDGEKVAEAMVFSGPTTGSDRVFRIESGAVEALKHGVAYKAVVNPYRRAEGAPPTVGVDPAAYQTIRAATVQAPANPDYPGDTHTTTDLCLPFHVERAGAAVRLLVRRGLYRVGDLQRCPPGAV
jgi:hypothetical protein